MMEAQVSAFNCACILTDNNSITKSHQANNYFHHNLCQPQDKTVPQKHYYFAQRQDDDEDEDEISLRRSMAEIFAIIDNDKQDTLEPASIRDSLDGFNILDGLFEHKNDDRHDSAITNLELLPQVDLNVTSKKRRFGATVKQEQDDPYEPIVDLDDAVLLDLFQEEQEDTTPQEPLHVITPIEEPVRKRSRPETENSTPSNTDKTPADQGNRSDSSNPVSRTKSCHSSPSWWEENLKQEQQIPLCALEPTILVRLEESMKRSAQSQSALQDWDEQNGLPRSHCTTMVKTARSRKQLMNGVVLPKWNGDPLIPGAKVSKRSRRRCRSDPTRG